MLLLLAGGHTPLSGRRHRKRRPSAFGPVRQLIHRVGLLISGALLAGMVDLLAIHAWVGDNRPTLLRVLFIASYGGALLVALLLLWKYRNRRRLRVRVFNELLALTPRQFESATGDLLHDLGYRRVRHVGGSGDLGADLECRDRDGQSVVVQCKRYAPGARVGSPDIQSFIGMVTVHHGAQRGLFVTTSEFTAPARELAKQHNIELIDGRTLSRLIERLRADASFSKVWSGLSPEPEAR